jgi:hypothetical protein
MGCVLYTYHRYITSIDPTCLYQLMFTPGWYIYVCTWRPLVDKGDRTSVAVLHLYDSFHQKCSKLGTVTSLGLKNKGREQKFKKRFFNAFSRPLKIYAFYEVQTFHSPKEWKISQARSVKLVHAAGSHIKILSRFPRSHWDRRIGFRGLSETAESDFGNFRIDFLGEYEAICKTALGRESGP